MNNKMSNEKKTKNNLAVIKRMQVVKIIMIISNSKEKEMRKRKRRKKSFDSLLNQI